ncbi:MAG TPA: HWE histidine kinase domain-containing protein [Bradyrhizobium sp.]|nr:HWE histidine kinase domain-containing protein [Bradyrhizobium sp.]
MLSRDASDIIITDELARRSAATPDYLREKLALRDLADDMAHDPSQVLPRLVRLAMEATEATSAGISILEHKDREFRWFALHGALAAFEGARTPGDFSPCAITLAKNAPVLMQHPETVYGWIYDAGISVPEVLLVPLQLRAADEAGAVGTLWVVASKSPHFSREHARVLTELAAFSAVAMRMIQSEQRLQAALGEQEQLTREMAHRIKNLLAITGGMLRLTARTSSSKDELERKLSGRLEALSAANQLVRRSFGDGGTSGVSLQRLVETVLRPYERAVMKGPDVGLGDHATNSMALIFHELATNAAKYGALSSENGTVRLTWSVENDRLNIEWKECGGPAVAEPSSKGFGTSLMQSTVSRHGGQMSCHWLPDGLLVSMDFPIASLAR